MRDESHFRLRHFYDKLIIWREIHETIDLAYHVESAKGYASSEIAVVFFIAMFVSFALVQSFLSASKYVDFDLGY